MKRVLLFIQVFSLFTAVPQMSYAGFITIETKTTASVSGKDIKISVAINNKGDESAHNVRIDLILLSKHYYGKIKDSLRANEKYEEEFAPTIELQKPGSYPFIVSVVYNDANLYPFNALSTGYLDYQESVASKISGKIAGISLSDKNTGAVIISNSDRVQRDISYELDVSKELIIEPTRGTIAVGPGRRGVIPFTVKNISALPGSTYAVFALLEYEDSEHHYSASTSGPITIGNHQFTKKYRNYLVTLLVILLLIVIVSNFRRKERYASKG